MGEIRPSQPSANCCAFMRDPGFWTLNKRSYAVLQKTNKLFYEVSAKSKETSKCFGVKT